MKGLLWILAFTWSAIAIASGGTLKNRIIDGTPVSTGALPWQVILKKKASDDLLCGGSVISSKWVLTAAHCTYGLTSVFLIFGTIQLNTYSTSMVSTQLTIHPQYNPSNLNNDISLIELPTALSFTSTIQAIPIVPSSQASNTFLGTDGLIAGYGYTDDEDLDFSNVLLSATVNIIDNSDCVAEFGSDIVIQSTMCAKGANNTNQSICSGDSGGPLITLDSSGNYMQIGINSFVAQDACTEGFPSGYSRLTSYLSYIQTVTNIDLS